LFRSVPPRSQRDATIRPVASDDLKRIVASEVALGASTGELAARFDYTPRGMRKLIATEGVQRLVVEERRALAETLDDYRADLVDIGAMAVENIRRIVGDPRHPKNAELSRWLLDRLAFPRPDSLAVQVDLPPPPTQEQSQAIADALQRLLAIKERDRREMPPIEDSPHLVRPTTGGR